MKYIVMETHLSYAVVLNGEGRFLKVANRNYTVGQTVTDVIEMQIPQKPPKKRKVVRWIYSAAAMAACLAIMVASLLHLENMTYASVYMAINPEVRIDVNRRDTVVGLEGVNDDGEDLIDGYDFNKKQLELVMEELASRAIDMGYLYEGGRISLTFDAQNDEWIVTHSDALVSGLNDTLREKLSVTIEITGGDGQGDKVVIPIPQEDEYGESDYGDSTPPETSTDTATDTNTGTNTNTGDSGFDDSGYGGSSSDDGQTDYDDRGDSSDGQSDYDESTPPPAPPNTGSGTNTGIGGDDTDDTNGDSDYDGRGSDYYGGSQHDDYDDMSDYGANDDDDD